MGGCKLLVREIFNRQDCERFNIDNIEVRTGVNVPKVLRCECVVKDKTKTATFVIDRDKVDLKEYILKQQFVKKDSLYMLSNTSKHTDWEATLLEETGELRFTLRYLK